MKLEIEIRNANELSYQLANELNNQDQLDLQMEKEINLTCK